MNETRSGIRLAPWARSLRQSILREMHGLLSRPGTLSLALGLPAAEMFPTEAFGRAASEVLAGDAAALQYGLPHQGLKRHVVKLMALRGVTCAEEQVFLTTGAQQGMDLLVRLLLGPDSSALVEEVTYDGILMVMRPVDPEILIVPSSPEEGLDLAAVEGLLSTGKRPAFIYAITEGHNPLGVSLSAAHRARLVRIAARHQIPIIEDDAYGFLSYNGEAAPPLRALDSDNVLYLGSFSKILAPALRAGWIVAPESLLEPLSIVKHAADLDVTTFAHRAVAAFLDGGHLPGHIAALRREYGARRDAMLGALEACFPPGARWRKPSSGMFVWVDLPGTIDAADLLRTCVETEKVAFVPGVAFSHAGGSRAAHGMRLSFSSLPPGRIEEGIERLGRALKRTL